MQDKRTESVEVWSYVGTIQLRFQQRGKQTTMKPEISPSALVSTIKICILQNS